MKLSINIFAALLILTGIVWFFQGINVLPGSFMTGQIGWAIAGVGAVIVGGGLLEFTNRRKGDPPTTGSG